MGILYIANIVLLACNAVLLICNSRKLKEADALLQIAERYKNDCAVALAKAKLAANSSLNKSDNSL